MTDHYKHPKLGQSQDGTNWVPGDQASQTTPSSIDEIFYRELRGKTVSADQASILRWAEQRLKPALNAYIDSLIPEKKDERLNITSGTPTSPPQLIDIEARGFNSAIDLMQRNRGGS